MKIILTNASGVSIESLEDFQYLVPDEADGEAVNFGQGEGQIKIGGSEWGFYVEGSDSYHYVLEEGCMELHEAVEIAQGILRRFQARWGEQIGGRVSTPFTE